MSKNGHNGHDVLKVGSRDEDKFPSKLKTYMLEHYAGWEDEAIKVDPPGAYQKTSVDASVDSVDAVLNAQKEMLRMMAEKGYPADQIKAVISALGEKSTDGNGKSTDDRQTKEDLATLERRRKRDRDYQEERRRKLKNGAVSSVDAKVGYISSSSLTSLEVDNDKKESKSSGIRASEWFEKFWPAYPKRLGGNPRKPALDQFTIALKNGHDPETIVRGAEGYAEECKKTNIVGTAYVAHARTWLRQQRWNDYQQKTLAAADFNSEEYQAARRRALDAIKGT